MPQFRPHDYVDRSWVEFAACEGMWPRSTMDQDIFFPDRGESTSKAREICGGCPVEDVCREYALITNETRGVWGGTSGRDRRLIAQARRKAEQASRDAQSAVSSST